MLSRSTRGLAVLGACALWAACSKGENKADSTAAATDTTAKATATPPAAPAPAALTDTNIFALLDEANAADSASGSIAATKGTNASVKDFGRMMERDHHTLRKAGQDLAKKLNITPNPPSGDTLIATSQKWRDSLNAMPKGAAWDKAYIDNEVNTHQAVLNLVQTAQGAATDTSLKALLTKAAPNIQAHLTKAQNIQSKLSGATASTAAPDSTKAAKKGKKD